MASKHRSAEKESFWRLAFEEFRTSGLSVRAFCAREGLAEPSFYSWRRTLRARNAEGASAEGGQVEMVPIHVVDRAADAGNDNRAPAPPLELVTPSGLTLRFPADIQPRQLATVLTAIIGEPAC